MGRVVPDGVSKSDHIGLQGKEYGYFLSVVKALEGLSKEEAQTLFVLKNINLAVGWRLDNGGLLSVIIQWIMNGSRETR